MVSKEKGTENVASVAQDKQETAVPLADLEWEEMHPGSPQVFSVLWGDHTKGPFGMLLKQPGGGFEAGMHTHASDYHAVLVQGTWIHTVEGDTSVPKKLTPGAYVFQPAWQYHNENFPGSEDCIIYIHQLGKSDYIKKASHDSGVPSEDTQVGD